MDINRQSLDIEWKVNIQIQAKWITYFYIVKLGNSFCLALYVNISKSLAKSQTYI